MSKQERLLNYFWPRSEYVSGEVYKIQKWRKQVLTRDHNKCKVCDNKLEDVYRKRKKSNEAHHIVPRHHGGKNTLNNGVTLCHFCHDYFDLVYFTRGLDYHQVMQEKTNEEIIKEVKNLMHIHYLRKLDHEIQRL
jgi:predicted restriction endonuclease